MQQGTAACCETTDGERKWAVYYLCPRKRHIQKHYFMCWQRTPVLPPCKRLPRSLRTLIFPVVLSPDVVGLALDLVPAEVHVSRLVRAAPSQPPALRPVLLAVTVHRGLARHAVASRPRGPPRSCDTEERGGVERNTDERHLLKPPLTGWPGSRPAN